MYTDTEHELYDLLYERLASNGNAYVDYTTNELQSMLMNVAYNRSPIFRKLEFGRVWKIGFDAIVTYTLNFTM